MPYVPSEITPNPSGIVKDGKAQDRVLIDKDVKMLSGEIAKKIYLNNSIAEELFRCFINIGNFLSLVIQDLGDVSQAEETYIYEDEVFLARTIWKVGKAYNYEGAFLGELNYAITRLIQEVPKRLVEQGKQKSELRYFIYALTVEALVKTTNYFNNKEQMVGIGGVFEDIKDEYKRRVNPGYEAAQIVKSGDCYDTPYYTKLIEIIDQDGHHVGYQEVMIERKNDNGLDVYGCKNIEVY